MALAPGNIAGFYTGRRDQLPFLPEEGPHSDSGGGGGRLRWPGPPPPNMKAILDDVVTLQVPISFFTDQSFTKRVVLK
jgi:hypothetical protein